MAKSIYLVIFLFSADLLFAQDPGSSKLRLSYSFLDIPQNLKTAGNYPSMRQSVELSSNLYDLSFWGIDAFGNSIIKNRNETTVGAITNRGIKYLLGFGFSYFGSGLPVPLGVFTHEEFHRSVLGINNLKSKNGNWLFNRWDGTVYGLSDEALSGLKLNSINDLLYSYVSGVQSENYMSQVNVIEDFFHPRTFYKNPLYLYNAYYVWDYFRFSASSLSDSAKVIAPPHEDVNAVNRDFAGADLTAWIYDMFSPEAPYTDRDLFPDKRMGIGGTLSIWSQPVHQGFFDQSGKFGGAIEMISDYDIGRGFSVNLAAGYKTVGWMIGNPYIDQKAGFRAGIKYLLRG